jgi:hypothetical protein
MEMENDFTQAIQSFAKSNRWAASFLDPHNAVLEVKSKSGRTQTVIIEYREDMLRFIVPGMAAFVDEFDMDHDVSTTLLRWNAELKNGCWIFIEINNEWVYAFQYYYQFPNRSIDRDMNSERFKKIVLELISECERFDDYWENVIL